MRIPLVRPLAPDMEDVSKLLRDSEALGVWSNFGPAHAGAIKELEAITKRHCVLTTNGTSAIDVALRSIKFKQERKIRVLVPDYTHCGTLQAVVNSGNQPILAPVRTDDWQLDLEHATECTDDFDAMIVVCPFGMKVDTSKYDAFAYQHGKLIVYDFAGAWGQFPITRYPVCYSLHATKNFNAGEGGLITFAQKDLSRYAFSFTNFCTNPDRSINSSRGYNFKIDEIKAAVVWSQAKRNDAILARVERKKALYLRYYDALKDFVTDQRKLFSDGSPSLCVFGGFGSSVQKIEKEALKHGIICKQYYPLLSAMPELQSVDRIWKSDEAYFSGCIALPSEVDQSEFEAIVNLIRTVY